VVRQLGEGDAPGTPPLVRSVTGANIFSPGSVRGTAISPRCRGDRSAVGRSVGRSPSSVGRAVGRSPSSRRRRDLAAGQGVTEATLDQSANCGWATLAEAHDDVALLPDVVSIALQ